jgi:hypothetical protein
VHRAYKEVVQGITRRWLYCEKVSGTPISTIQRAVTYGYASSVYSNFDRYVLNDEPHAGGDWREGQRRVRTSIA